VERSILRPASSTSRRSQTLPCKQWRIGQKDRICGTWEALHPPEGRGIFPGIKPPWGRVTAIDLNTGDHIWMQANGDASDRIKNNPALEGIQIGRWGKATRAGILVTNTLVLAGEGYGGDPHFYAYDKATGEIIADLEIPTSRTSLPMTYMYEGEPYVVFTVGGEGEMADLIAMALPWAHRPRAEKSGHSWFREWPLDLGAGYPAIGSARFAGSSSSRDARSDRLGLPGLPPP